MNQENCPGGQKELEDRLANAEALVSDVDGTAHPYHFWTELRQLLPPKAAAANAVASRSYWQREPSAQEELELLFGPIPAMYGWDRKVLRKLVATFVPRIGFVPLFRSFRAEHVLLNSFGIWDPIHDWLEQFMSAEEANACQIAALRLRWGVNGHEVIVGYDPHTAVTGYTKGEFAQAFLSRVQVSNHRALVLGDSKTDIRMFGHGRCSVLIVPRSYDTGLHAHLSDLEALWPHLTAVLVSDSWDSLVDMRRSVRLATPAEVAAFGN
ncbi:MAG: hypothetical protein WCT24_01895 [Patescibacteria group bacterium]